MRYALILAYPIFGMVGVYFVFVQGAPTIGWTCWAIGLLAYGINSLLTFRDNRRETLLGLEWLRQVQAIANKTDMRDYPVPLEDLPSYFFDTHDRIAIVDALMMQPEGARDLYLAVASVDPDGTFH